MFYPLFLFVFSGFLFSSTIFTVFNSYEILYTFSLILHLPLSIYIYVSSIICNLHSLFLLLILPPAPSLPASAPCPCAHPSPCASQITINNGEECVLEDNSHRTKWKVISPTGNEAMVPSVCFTIPPPNQDAIDTAGR